MRQPHAFNLFNSLTRKIEPLRTADEKVLRYYSCGPTVYSYAHIGNLRSFLTADLVVRVARAIGYKVLYVSNITDVGHLVNDNAADGQGEDKMLSALRSKEGERFPTIWDLARYYADSFLKDCGVLRLVEPTVRPRATEHVAQQIEMIEKLLANGHAYETSMGVYFSVPSFKKYGMLSGNTKLSDLAGTREVVTDTGKRDFRDFALWKKDRNHLMRWFSPFGWGYPGWHIECSAMATAYLGETIDLHSGGLDNKFPHHECEIAQSESVTSKNYCGHWIHTGYLTVNGEKMSKSLGNFYTLKDLTQAGDVRMTEAVDPLAVRFALTASRYREPLNFTMEHLVACSRNLQRLLRIRQEVEVPAPAGTPSDSTISIRGDLETLSDQILDAMLDDLNTSKAFALVLKGASLIEKNSPLSESSKRAASAWLDKIDNLLGVIPPLSERRNVNSLQGRTPEEIVQIEKLVAERDGLRRVKDFEGADRIKKELNHLGVEVMDTSTGSKWK